MAKAKKLSVATFTVEDETTAAHMRAEKKKGTTYRGFTIQALKEKAERDSK